MRTLLVLCLLFFIVETSLSEKHKNEPFPTQIVIGRDRVIDVGPPFNYYDLTFLLSKGEDTDVERISLTPPGDVCYPRVDIKVAHVVLHEALSSLLQFTNPCSIPDKALKAELKRRKKGVSVFSGMNVSIQVQCADKTRILHADVLDRDIFDEHPKTPQYTAWSRAIFEKLDQVTGDRPWDTPLFPVSDGSSALPSQRATESIDLEDVANGKYDAIFGEVSDRFSKLYRLAQDPPRQPFIELTKSDPVRPATYVDPNYPPIAKLARVHGNVDFHLTVGEDGLAHDVSIESGPKMLWQATTDAIAKWRFSLDDHGRNISGSVRFGLNCASEAK